MNTFDETDCVCVPFFLVIVDFYHTLITLWIYVARENVERSTSIWCWFVDFMNSDYNFFSIRNILKVLKHWNEPFFCMSIFSMQRDQSFTRLYIITDSTLSFFCCAFEPDFNLIESFIILRIWMVVQNLDSWILTSDVWRANRVICLNHIK